MASVYYVVSFLFLLINLSRGMESVSKDNCPDSEDYDYGVNTIEHNNTMRIHLRRQNSAMKEHLNTPLHKYGITLDWLYEKPKPNNRTNDTISLYRYLDHEFYGEIVIGHPGQKLNVAFDTTWSYSWVLSSQCNGLTEIGCYFHNKYNHYKSSEYKPDGRKFEVDEGSYKLTGFFSYDNISISHSNVTNFSFVEMVKVPRNLILNKADGVMGLGQAIQGYEPFFDTLIRQKKINSSIFSVYINRNHQSKKGGIILLGFIDKEHIKCNVIGNKKIRDTILYTSIEPNLNYWQFTLNQMILVKSSKENETIGSKNVPAIIDTSSSIIIGPVEDVALIHERIQARKFLLNRYTVDCDRVNQLPKIVFIIGDKTFEFSGPKYITKLTWASVSICMSAFQPAEDRDEQERWILGTTFLAEVYTVFDRDNKRLGFAHAA